MNFKVFIEIALLSKRLSTSSLLAHKRLLLGVRPEVIKQVVPLSKDFVTSVVLTEKDLSPSLALLLKVLGVLKGPDGRNV